MIENHYLPDADYDRLFTGILALIDLDDYPDAEARVGELLSDVASVWPMSIHPDRLGADMALAG